MKILKLELQNFGKFQNEVLELNDGIQLFYGENESGKTTIHTFIKSMLFGMSRGKIRDIMQGQWNLSAGKSGFAWRGALINIPNGRPLSVLMTEKNFRWNRAIL